MEPRCSLRKVLAVALKEGVFSFNKVPRSPETKPREVKSPAQDSLAQHSSRHIPEPR